MKRLGAIFLFIFLIGLTNLGFADFKSSSYELYGGYLKGLTYFDQGEYTKALAEFQRIKKIDPQSSAIRLKISFLLVKLDKFDQAEKELKSIKKIDPQNIEVSLGLIFLYSFLKRDKELDFEYGEFLEKVHHSRPDDIKIAEYLAQFYFYKDRINDALKLYEAIVEIHPDYVDARYLLGYFYEEKGLRKKAIKIWKKSLEFNPIHPDTLNSLGYLYAEQGKNLNEAKELIEKALEQDPNNGAYLDSLGWVYFKAKDYKKAEDNLKKAIIFAKDPVIYGHLGDLYINLNKIDEALNNYKKGLELDPDNKSLQKKINKYERKNKKSKK